MRLSSIQKLSYDQPGKVMNLMQMTVFRDIEKLKKEGKIKRIGPAKGGYWQVIYQQKK